MDKIKDCKQIGNSGKVSVVVPTLNEEKYIKACLDSILMQDYPHELLEIILVDGMSCDSTREIIKDYTKKCDFIKLFDNPNKTVQYAMNIGIENSCGEFIVRMDAHASYAKDYISKCIQYLKTTGADNVGGTTVVRGKTFIQKVIAAAYHSPFALGGSQHYDESYEGYTDTVAWGSFKRSTLVDIGMYDERLPRSEDDDLNFRISENGGKIFVTPKIKSIYYPKDSFLKLFKQYYNYGKWKVAVIQKHHRPSRIVHLVPMLFVAFLMLFGIFSIFSNLAAYVFCSVMSLYFILSIYFSFKSNHIKTLSGKLVLVFAHFVIHVSYGLGFWSGIVKFFGRKW